MMNRTKIEWTDYTWNPITGCSRGCPYCYARRMAFRLRGRYGYPEDYPFAVTFHKDRLDEPYSRRKPARIFTCSMGEMFDHLVPRNWLEQIFEIMENTQRHVYQVLTKRYYDLTAHDYPENLWLGVSQDNKTTDTDAIRALLASKVRVKFISFEPLLGPLPDDIANEGLYGIDWVIIGAQTGHGAVKPDPEWVEQIISEASYFDIPIFLKNNLSWPEKMQVVPQ